MLAGVSVLGPLLVASGGPVGAELPSSGTLGFILIESPDQKLRFAPAATEVVHSMERDGGIPLYLLCVDRHPLDDVFCAVDLYGAAGEFGERVGEKLAHANSSASRETITQVSVAVPRASYEGRLFTNLYAVVRAVHGGSSDVPFLVEVFVWRA